MIKCSECGTENPDNAEFCKKCGNNLGVSTSSSGGLSGEKTSSGSLPGKEPQGETKRKSKAEKYDKYSKILGIASIFFLGILIGPVAIIIGFEARQKNTNKGNMGIVLGMVGLAIWGVALIAIMPAQEVGTGGGDNVIPSQEEEESVNKKDLISAELKLSAEELEATGDRYVNLEVFIKNDSKEKIKIEELKYFSEFGGIWGDPAERQFPIENTVPTDTKTKVGELTIHEDPSDRRGTGWKVKVVTKIGGFWTNVVKDYSYKLVEDLSF